MKREFRKGDVIVQIGTMDKLWVYSVDRDFYYVTNLATGIPEVWTPDLEERFVKIGRISEKKAHDLAASMKLSRNSQYGIFYNLTIPLAQSM